MAMLCPTWGFRYLPISDGQIFSVEGATLRAIHTPGHAGDHVVLWLEPDRCLFSGDHVLGWGTSWVEDLGLFLAWAWLRALAYLLAVHARCHPTPQTPPNPPKKNRLATARPSSDRGRQHSTPSQASVCTGNPQNRNR